jgi:hypothetical protein
MPTCLVRPEGWLAPTSRCSPRFELAPAVSILSHLRLRIRRLDDALQQGIVTLIISFLSPGHFAARPIKSDEHPT